MGKIKTLANCTDEEFLRQTYAIYEAVEKWLTVTDIANIRKRLPAYEIIPKDADEETKKEINARNEELKVEQVSKNTRAILKACMEDHPEETVKIIRMCCFVDPSDNSRKITFYMNAFNEMLNDPDVLNFFTSLVNMAQRFGLTV